MVAAITLYFREQGMKLNKRWQRFLISSSLIVVMLAALGGAVLAYLGSAANVIEVDTETPRIVLVNQAFDVALTLHNTTDSQQELISIGVERDLLEQGLRVVEMVPPYREADELSQSKWVEFTFAIQRRPVMQADESLRMRVAMVITQPGTYQGEWAVWTKNQPQADYTQLTIVAVEHPAPWLGR